MQIQDPQQISIFDYTYDLPEHRIAQYPLEERDASKLIVYRDGQLSESRFFALSDALPEQSLLVFNTTRVVRARILLQRETGAWVELFCTDAADSSVDFARLLEHKGTVVVKCFVGNGKRWKEGEQLQLSLQNGVAIVAEKLEPIDDQWRIRLTWNSDALSFAEILDDIGKIPLPPYMKRDEEASDAERYQTIYAQHNGSVAAPTAGLHFTTRVLDQLREKNIAFADVTLHVGAGTFKPVKADAMRDHTMHREQIIVSRNLIEQLLQKRLGPITAVGTTAMRTLESLYWFGRQLVTQPGRHRDALFVEQWEPYTAGPDVPVAIALRTLHDWMIENNQGTISGYTQLLIAPGYQFRIVDALITNFHQPQSTLLLLVAAFVGEDYRMIYQYALDHDFRFLSYGDSSLLFRKKEIVR